MGTILARVAGVLAMALTMAWAPQASAQGAQKVYRVAVLSYMPGDREFLHIKELMTKTGYVEGRNVEYLWRPGIRDGTLTSGAKAKLKQDVIDIIAWKPDVILALNTNAGVGIKENPAASHIPVVMWGSNMKEAGFVKTYRKPGGQFTGFTGGSGGDVLYIRFLKKSIPNFKRLAHMYNGSYAVAPADLRATAELGRQMGFEVKVYDVTTPEQIEPAIAQMKKDGMQAIKMGPHELFNTHGEEIGRLALKYGLPAVGQASVMKGGGVMNVGGKPDWIYMMPVVDKVLKGAKPADIPVQRNWPPFITIDMNHARRVGMKVPDEILEEAYTIIDDQPLPPLKANNVIPVKQYPGKVWKVALLSYGAIGDAKDTKARFEELGYKEGVNIEYMLRGGNRDGTPNSGAKERMKVAVKEIVAWKPDLIFQLNTNAGTALRENPDAAVFPTIGWSTHAVGAGFADSFRRPGRNFTGFSQSPFTNVLYMRAMMRLIPDLKVMGHLINPSYAIAEADLAELRSAAALYGVEIRRYDCTRREDFESCVAKMKADGMQAFHVGPHETFNVFGQELGQLSQKYKIPAIGRGNVTRGGGIMSIGGGWSFDPVMPSLDKLMKGTNPGEIPIYRYFAPRMTLNPKAAAQLGIVIPEDMLDTADNIQEEGVQLDPSQTG